MDRWRIIKDTKINLISFIHLISYNYVSLLRMQKTPDYLTNVDFRFDISNPLKQS